LTLSPHIVVVDSWPLFPGLYGKADVVLFWHGDAAQSCMVVVYEEKRKRKGSWTGHEKDGVMIKYTLPVFYAHLQLAYLCNLRVDNVPSIALPLVFQNCISVFSGT
jgi:hypothetical protein